jgi:hypothetical protein
MPYIAIQTTDSLYFILFNSNLDLKKIIKEEFLVEQAGNFTLLVF